MQVIENLTQITGTLASRSPHPTLPDWDLVSVAVETAQPVPGYADLLSQHAGSSLELGIRRELLGDAQPGARLRLRAKFTPEGARAEGHPEPGDFELQPPA